MKHSIGETVYREVTFRCTVSLLSTISHKVQWLEGTGFMEQRELNVFFKDNLILFYLFLTTACSWWDLFLSQRIKYVPCSGIMESQMLDPLGKSGAEVLVWFYIPVCNWAEDKLPKYHLHEGGPTHLKSVVLIQCRCPVVGWMHDWTDPILRAQFSKSKWKWQWTHQICKIKWYNDYIALTTIIGMWQAIHSWDLYHSMFLAWNFSHKWTRNYLCWWESTINMHPSNEQEGKS